MISLQKKQRYNKKNPAQNWTGYLRDVHRVGATCRARTYDPAVNSRMLYQLS